MLQNVVSFPWPMARKMPPTRLCVQEAVIDILEAQVFFGEGCLAGQPRRIATATAFTDCLDGLWARPGRGESRRRNRQTSPRSRGVALDSDRWVLLAGR